MPTKTVNTNTNQYDPGSMNTYQGLQGGIGSSINSYMNAAKSFMPLWMQQSNQAINQIGNRMNTNLLSNATANGGAGNLGAYMQANMARNARATGGMQANAFLNSRFQAASMQMQGTQMAENYHPLQTGSTQTQQVSGLGTWLPQVIGAGLSIGSMAAGVPGLGKAFGSVGGQSDPALGQISYMPGQQGNPQAPWGNGMVPSAFNPGAGSNPYMPTAFGG